MITVDQEFTFAYGHRLVGHESKCAHYHGHTAHVRVSFAGESLDKVGRLVDFSETRERLGAWIDKAFDHAMVLRYDDPMIEMLAPRFAKSEVLATLRHGYEPTAIHIVDDAPYRLTVLGRNPSSEVIADVIMWQADRLFGHRFVCTRVAFAESPKNTAAIERTPAEVARALENLRLEATHG